MDKRTDEFLYDEDDMMSPEEPFWADEFGERIVDDRIVDGVPEDDDVELEDELISETTTADMDMPDLDEDFHETLADSNISDQLDDNDLVGETEDENESLMDKAKDKLEDLKDNF